MCRWSVCRDLGRRIEGDGVNEGVDWQDTSAIVLLWVAAFGCLVGLKEVRWSQDLYWRKSGPPRPIEFVARMACVVIFALALTVVLFGIYYWFGILFVVALALASPLVLVALAVWSPLRSRGCVRPAGVGLPRFEGE